jgi:hypothetical protein
MKKIILTLLVLVALAPLVNAQLTFEDLEFKNRLLNHNPPIDGNQDGEITKAEAEAFDNPHIDVRGDGHTANLTSVQGIEYFTQVIYFTCESNPGLTSIDVSEMPQLVRLRSHSSGLTSVNVSGLTKLEEISIHHNKVTSLDLSSASALITLRATDNKLTSIDVSNCPNLKYLRVSKNELTSLNAKNGSNTKISNFESSTNTNLTCIEVDDVDYSNTNWTKKDATSEFKTSCGGSASIAELSQNIKVYPNPTTNTLNISSEYPSDQFIITDITGKEVLNITSSSTSVDVSMLPRGIYILKAIGPDRTGTSRFIKQ